MHARAFHRRVIGEFTKADGMVAVDPEAFLRGIEHFVRPWRFARSRLLLLVG
jgi:hypothetical protein